MRFLFAFGFYFICISSFFAFFIHRSLSFGFRFLPYFSSTYFSRSKIKQKWKQNVENFTETNTMERILPDTTFNNRILCFVCSVSLRCGYIKNVIWKSKKQSFLRIDNVHKLYESYDFVSFSILDLFIFSFSFLLLIVFCFLGMLFFSSCFFFTYVPYIVSKHLPSKTHFRFYAIDFCVASEYFEKMNKNKQTNML